MIYYKKKYRVTFKFDQESVSIQMLASEDTPKNCDVLLGAASAFHSQLPCFGIPGLP